MYENIEKERQRYGLSVEEMSYLLGINPEQYWEQEWKRQIPAETLRTLSQIFECSIDYLLGLE